MRSEGGEKGRGVVRVGGGGRGSGRGRERGRRDMEGGVIGEEGEW